MKKFYYILIPIALAFFILGWSSFKYLKHSTEVGQPIRENSTEYKFINPLLVVDNSKIKFPELDPLKKEFQNYIDESISENKASQISVYFRDVNTIKWTGVNEDALYSPSSMLKVFILIAYLKLIDQDPNITKKQFYYEFIDDSGQFYKPEPLEKGYYNASDLIKQMIVYSDNTAMRILEEELFDRTLKIHDELDLPSGLENQYQRDFMSPIQYSRIFRMLYNSTYLPRIYSEQALNLLTQTRFNRGISVNIPSNIAVAHKFGEKTFTKNGTIEYRELHDCGIVYYPEHPYLLCIMTKGQDFSKLEEVIADLSKIAYDYQNQN